MSFFIVFFLHSSWNIVSIQWNIMKLESRTNWLSSWWFVYQLLVVYISISSQRHFECVCVSGKKTDLIFIYHTHTHTQMAQMVKNFGRFFFLPIILMYICMNSAFWNKKKWNNKKMKTLKHKTHNQTFRKRRMKKEFVSKPKNKWKNANQGN